MFTSVICKRSVQTADPDPVAERNHRDRGQGENHRDHRRRNVQRLIDVRRRQIFFEKKFDSVGQRLQQPERPHPRGSPAVLHVAHDLALQPNRIGHRRQQHEKCQHSLDYGNDDEVSMVKLIFQTRIRSSWGFRPIKDFACGTYSIASSDYASNAHITTTVTCSVCGDFGFRRLIFVLDHRIQCPRITSQSSGTEKIVVGRHNLPRILLLTRRHSHQRSVC